MLDSTATTQTQEVLDTLNAALEAGDAAAAAALFATDSYWRDLISVSWNLKTVEGPEGVADMLTHQLARTQPGQFRIQDGEAPVAFEIRIGAACTENSGRQLNALLNEADYMLYQSRNEQRPHETG